MANLKILLLLTTVAILRMTTKSTTSHSQGESGFQKSNARGRQYSLIQFLLNPVSKNFAQFSLHFTCHGQTERDINSQYSKLEINFHGSSKGGLTLKNIFILGQICKKRVPFHSPEHYRPKYKMLRVVVYQRTAGPLGLVLKKLYRSGPFRTLKLPKGPLRTAFLIQELLLIFSKWLPWNFNEKPTSYPNFNGPYRFEKFKTIFSSQCFL